MRLTDPLRRLAFLAALTAAVPACSRDKAAGDQTSAVSIDALTVPSLLKAVPAEAPYYFAAVRPLSPEVRAKRGSAPFSGRSRSTRASTA